MTDPRKRIGLLIPSSSSTQEPEFARALPPHVTVHAARLPLTKIESGQTERVVAEIEKECRKLGDADVDVIALPATAPSSQKGTGYDLELIKRMSDASGKPATVASTALVAALKTLGAKRLVIGAPWSQTVNESVAAFLTASGFDVLDHQALGHVDNLTVGRLDESTGYEMGLKVDRADAEVVMLACGNWCTMGVIDRLEQKLQKPVVTTNQVTLWAALKIIGTIDSVGGHGTLLRDHLGKRSSAAAD